ncbi:MAG: 23S rRNA (uracil(1939)-C(5))-methyltransferase RlmD, partial [Spirochaetales bacterium]|nr:23S rRNA (uracil(1939)-C(5))-methyltransferase RlmD [Spirochaetales bacterium]
KLEFSFGAQRWLSEYEVAEAAEIDDRRGLGFHVAGRFDRVLDLTECHLQGEPSESIRTFVRDYSREYGLTYYDSRSHCGFLRLLTVRTSLSGEAMVIVTFGEDRPDDIRAVMEAIQARFVTLHSLNYVVNTSKNDSMYPHEVVTWSGESWITELCGPNRLRVRPKAFYQTNPLQAVRLYEAALALLRPTRDDLVFDLYSGIGSIALLAARSVGRVVGIESVPDAVRAARENARVNGIDNALFEEGAVEDTLCEVAARYGTPDAVVVDPPRAGLHPRAIDSLRDLRPPRILYISCNPRTQASDIAALRESYRVEALQPVDMFPQTRHVENIAVLRRR